MNNSTFIFSETGQLFFSSDPDNFVTYSVLCTFISKFLSTHGKDQTLSQHTTLKSASNKVKSRQFWDYKDVRIFWRHLSAFGIYIAFLTGKQFQLDYFNPFLATLTKIVQGLLNDSKNDYSIFAEKQNSTNPGSIKPFSVDWGKFNTIYTKLYQSFEEEYHSSLTENENGQNGDTLKQPLTNGSTPDTPTPLTEPESTNSKNPKNPNKKTKKRKIWDRATTKFKSYIMDTPSKNPENGTNNSSTSTTSMESSIATINLNFDSPEATDSNGQGKDNSSATGTWFSSLVSKMTGKKTFSREELEPVMELFKTKLVEKNVGIAVASKLCDSILTSLENSTTTTFTSLESTIKESLTAEIVKILTPPNSLKPAELLRRIRARNASSEKKPYSIAFCGVNGVGKSTSLSKIAAWLQQNEISVMIAACDTFRSGAVEQLANHASKIGVKLYQQGYNKKGEDKAATVAKNALLQAEREGIQVVLIDTAGRMQDNTQLMKALSHLVYVNSPDLILFVGEALVGNDGMNQLSIFASNFSNYTPPSGKSTDFVKRTIDGIILTKFDTIDDNVGAALSMVFSTGFPIVFVGTGQTYENLKVLDANTIVRTLLQ